MVNPSQTEFLSSSSFICVQNISHSAAVTCNTIGRPSWSGPDVFLSAGSGNTNQLRKFTKPLPLSKEHCGNVALKKQGHDRIILVYSYFNFALISTLGTKVVLKWTRFKTLKYIEAADKKTFLFNKCKIIDIVAMLHQLCTALKT